MVDSKHSCFSRCKADSRDSENGLELINFSKIRHWHIIIPAAKLFCGSLGMPWNSSGGQRLTMRIQRNELGRILFLLHAVPGRNLDYQKFPNFTSKVVQCYVTMCSDTMSKMSVTKSKVLYSKKYWRCRLNNFDFLYNILQLYIYIPIDARARSNIIKYMFFISLSTGQVLISSKGAVTTTSWEELAGQYRGSSIGVLKSRFPAFFSSQSRHPAPFYALIPIPPHYALWLTF